MRPTRRQGGGPFSDCRGVPFHLAVATKARTCPRGVRAQLPAGTRVPPGAPGLRGDWLLPASCRTGRSLRCRKLRLAHSLVQGVASDDPMPDHHPCSLGRVAAQRAPQLGHLLTIEGREYRHRLPGTAASRGHSVYRGIVAAICRPSALRRSAAAGQAYPATSRGALHQDGMRHYSKRMFPRGRIRLAQRTSSLYVSVLL